MSTKPADTESIPEAPAAVTPSLGSMHRPGHSPLDTIEIAATDDVLHEAALRDSSLRVPR
jgi:hypothetical protein